MLVAHENKVLIMKDAKTKEYIVVAYCHSAELAKEIAEKVSADGILQTPSSL